jgi:hypothetical protein
MMLLLIASPTPTVGAACPDGDAADWLWQHWRRCGGGGQWLGGITMAWWRHCGSTTEWRWRRGEQWNSGGGFVWNDGANDFGGLLAKFESPLKIGASNF